MSVAEKNNSIIIAKHKVEQNLYNISICINYRYLVILLQEF